MIPIAYLAQDTIDPPTGQMTEGKIGETNI